MIHEKIMRYVFALENRVRELEKKVEEIENERSNRKSDSIDKTS